MHDVAGFLYFSGRFKYLIVIYLVFSLNVKARVTGRILCIFLNPYVMLLGFVRVHGLE